MSSLPTGWKLASDGKSIHRVYELSGFAAAVALVNLIAARAEATDHHPDLHLTGYRRLEVVLSTHDAGTVTAKDYALAAEIEALPKDSR
jgi:4a-hydroxytetrahydrobiopterin dehydratase